MASHKSVGNISKQNLHTIDNVKYYIYAVLDIINSVQQIVPYFAYTQYTGICVFLYHIHVYLYSLYT